MSHPACLMYFETGSQIISLKTRYIRLYVITNCSNKQLRGKKKKKEKENASLLQGIPEQAPTVLLLVQLRFQWAV